MKLPGRILLVFLVSLGTLNGKAKSKPSPSPKPTPTPTLSPDDELNRQATDFISGYLSARPLQGVALGFHQYDGKIGDYSRLAIDAEVERLKRFQGQLQKFDPAKLGAEAERDRRILLAAIARELFEIEDMGIFERNPMTYAHAIGFDIYIKRDFKPLEDRLRDIVMIEDQAANIMTAAKTNLVEVLPKPYVELAIQIANALAGFLEKDVVAAVKEVSDEQLMAAFQDANKKAAAALRDYATWLAKERLPKANAAYALGTEKYRRMLAGAEMVDLAPDKLLALGLRKLEEEKRVFAEAARVIDPKKKPVEVFKAIQQEHPKPDQLVSEVAKDLEKIRQFVLDHHVVAIPSEVRASVKPTPPFERATSFASMDTPGPFEKKSTEAYYYVTPTEPEWSEQQKKEWLTSFNYYTSDVTSIHEAYPGHYVQFLHLNASPATLVQKIFNSYSFVEGWAHYAEQMMLEEGFGRASKPAPEEKMRAAKYRLAQADEALLRLCRLCVSIKMHTQGMSVAEAARFFQENCYYEAKPSMAEAMRGTYDPGYLNYTLGKLAFLKLRDDYKAQEGKIFSLEKFHNELLNHGAPPIRLLREILLKEKSQWDVIL